MPHPVRTLLHTLQGWLATCSLRQPGRLARKHVLPAASHRSIAWPLLTFGLLLAATVWMWRSTAAEVNQIARERFDFKVAEALFAIEQRLLAYEQVQRGGVALFAASNEVTRDQWRTYVRQLNLEKNYPGIQAMAFSRRLLPAELNGFVQRTRPEGLETAIAGDGFFAGSLLHTFKPHLMTLDLRMPGIDGFGVLRFLRETQLPTPLKVLVVSGDSEEHFKQALALGAHGALCKPFDNEELLAGARELLGEAKAPTPATRPRTSSG